MHAVFVDMYFLDVSNLRFTRLWDFVLKELRTVHLFMGRVMDSIH